MSVEDIAKSSQEQAVAAWIGYLNQVRIDALVARLAQQDTNLERALASVDDALKTIHTDIINAVDLRLSRGSLDGMHGFIAEVAEVGVSNARRLILGEAANNVWIDDDGPADILRDGITNVQQKFSQSGGYLSLRAVEQHLKKYPDYLQDHGVYQIPRDHYDMVRKLYEMSEHDANRLPTQTGDGPTLRQWKWVHDFFDRTDMDIDQIEPSKLAYDEVQHNTIDTTMEAERERLAEQDREVRNAALAESQPSWAEAGRATAVAAGLEGATALVMGVSGKLRAGKRLRDFDADDWGGVAVATGSGAIRGGVRGVSVYALTNYTATPAAVAGALVTAAFAVAEQAHRLRVGEISEVEFVANSELLCLDVSVNALSSFVGQAVIPVPVLGTVVGNVVGTTLYQLAKDGLSEREQRLLRAYAEEQRRLDEELDQDYRRCLELLEDTAATFFELLDRAYSPDAATALEGSIALARELGVDPDLILDTPEKAYRYFAM